MAAGRLGDLGALFFGRLAATYGAYRCIFVGCFAWMAIVVAALAVGVVAALLPAIRVFRVDLAQTLARA